MMNEEERSAQQAGPKKGRSKLPHSRVRALLGRDSAPKFKRVLNSIAIQERCIPKSRRLPTATAPRSIRCSALSGQTLIGSQTQGDASLCPRLSYVESRWDSRSTEVWPFLAGSWLPCFRRRLPASGGLAPAAGEWITKPDAMPSHAGATRQ